MMLDGLLILDKRAPLTFILLLCVLRVLNVCFVIISFETNFLSVVSAEGGKETASVS